MSDYLLGFDIGGTKCAIVLGRLPSTTGGDERPDIIARREFPTEREPMWTLRHLENLAREMILQHNLRIYDFRGLGISCGGPLDAENGVVLGPPNLPGWDHVPLTSIFEASFGIPARLQNDADACALAEWKWGAGRGSRHMIFLTFGTGMGAGLILNGQLYSGASGLAGEVGHLRLANDGPLGHGKRGSFEGFCSGGGIAQLARDRVREAWSAGQPVSFCETERQLYQLSAATVAEAAQQGDELALEILATSARCLGRGLAILIDVLNPEVVVIGGIFARRHDLFWSLAEEVLRAEALGPAVAACRVVPAQLGEEIGDYACLSIAAEIPASDDSKY